MEQIIFLDTTLCHNMTDMINLSSRASMAFINTYLMNSAYPYEKYDAYYCVDGNGQRRVYSNPILDELSYNNFMVGRKKFFVKETYEDGELIAAEDVVEELCYDCNIQFDADVYEQWVKTGSEKSILSATQQGMLDVISKAVNLGLKENEDFFLIKQDDQITAIGFKPLHNVINKQLTENFSII